MTIILKDQFQLNKTSSPEHQKHIHGKVTSPADMPDLESCLKIDRWGCISVQDGDKVRIGEQDYMVRAQGSETVLEAV